MALTATDWTGWSTIQNGFGGGNWATWQWSGATGSGVLTQQENANSAGEDPADPWLFAWTDAGEALDVEMLAKVKFAVGPPSDVSTYGWGLHARASAVNAGYRFLVQNDGVAYLFVDTKNAAQLTGKPHGLTLTEGTSYWMRFKVTGTKAGEDLSIQGRVWEDGDSEPLAWLIDYDHTGIAASEAIEVPGYVGVGNAGGGGWSTSYYDPKVYTVSSFSASLTALPDEPATDPEVSVQFSQDRLRSSVSESVGSLLDSVEARPVDARAGEDFTSAQDLDVAVLTFFREVTRARGSSTTDFSYFPRPRQNIVEENQYDGITVLSRLSTWFPPTMFDTVANLGIVASGAATAQQVIQHALDEWATLVPWLTVGTVPDLRLRKEFLDPGDYGASDGVVSTETLTIDQSGDARRDALSVLQDLLSPFPGTIIRQDSTGTLQIVPTYGPDADATAIVTLDEQDLYSVSRGKPDPFSIKNRVTISNTGHSRTGEVALMQPAWFQVGSNYQLGRSTWYEPPGDRLNLQEPAEGDTTLQESLESGEFGAQRPAAWPKSSESIPAGTGISLKDGSDVATITAAWSRYNGDSLEDTGTGTLTMLEDEIPFDGVMRDTFKFDEGTVSLTIRCRWDAATESVQFSLGPAVMESGCFSGCKGWVVEFTLNDSSVGYAENPSKTATFGIVDDGDFLPAATGGNAVADSQAEYGVLEADISIRGYDLDLTTLQQIARAYVLENITPRVTRELDLSSVGTRLTFDHIGRLIELPSGEQGFLTGVEYGDDFTAASWRKTASVQINNANADGAVADTDIYYLTSEGEAYVTTDASLLGLLAGPYEVTDDA